MSQEEKFKILLNGTSDQRLVRWHEVPTFSEIQHAMYVGEQVTMIAASEY